MENIVKTPLAVIYVDEQHNMSISDNLDLCRVSQVWGVYLGIKDLKLNLFISKVNGPMVTLDEADKWAFQNYEAVYFDEGDKVFYPGLPHFEEVLMLSLGYVSEINKTMAIFRKNGIVADNLFNEKKYLVYSMKAFADANDLHIRRVKKQKTIAEPFMYQAMHVDDGGDDILDLTASDRDKSDMFCTRLFLHCFT